jgi:hypothetical protein
LYHINKLNAIKVIKNIICKKFSILSNFILFQNIFFKIVFIVNKKNLHQSRAGIGRRLKIHKLIEIIAVIIDKNTIHAHKL